LIEDINKLVLQAGKIALDYFGRVKVSFKPDRSVVTEADLKVEQFLHSELTKLIPSSDFLGEEGTSGSQDYNSEYLWIVDPIDGSSSYCNGLPVWGVSVALYKNHKPYLASVYFPLVNDLFWNDESNKTFQNNKELRALSTNMEMGPESFVCIPSNLCNNCNLRICMKARSFGSSCYHILQVARNAAFATILCKLGVWDIAASAAIAVINGAQLYDLKGNPYSLPEIIQSGQIPEPLIVTHPDRLASVLKNIESL
jgi:myo-inositol-1(or 4)-monophosphatase